MFEEEKNKLFASVLLQARLGVYWTADEGEWNHMIELKLIIELVSIEPIWAEINIGIERACVQSRMEQDISATFFKFEFLA